MNLSEVATIIEDHEAEVWTEYIEPLTRSNLPANKTTLRDISPRQGFIVFVDRGSSEGIYLTVEGIDNDGKRRSAFVCKTLEDPDSEHWDECWLSAGRISRALEDIWW